LKIYITSISYVLNITTLSDKMVTYEHQYIHSVVYWKYLMIRSTSELSIYTI